MGTVSDEHGERFHHDISQIEERYRGKWSPNILADHCWSLIRETPTGENKRRKKSVFLINFFLVRIPYIETQFIT
jgi:hypothetical protein